ncbi:hypothetical protein ABKW02_24320, partial [Enterobacter cloacae]
TELSAQSKINFKVAVSATINPTNDLNVTVYMHHIEQIFINGEFVTPHGTERFDLYNPATAQVIGQVRLADEGFG